ncbi:Vacuolar-sorting receptor 1 [Cymbomonas tetramitiformis]|uniref:Vacuolar-sorting receptor 1 n=1 Tax=Cymbomonas tetramitiformis TaxID=36881 RepID=A0AAE0BSK0_9CHLO|nr:Vacuolar-sorting receptor 1 [Cymbomonas tetramitiformis]
MATNTCAQSAESVYIRGIYSKDEFKTPVTGTLANFGRPGYGTQLLGELRYHWGHSGCSATDYTENLFENVSAGVGNILLLHHGAAANCSVIDMALKAQENGHADACVIIDELTTSDELPGTLAHSGDKHDYLSSLMLTIPVILATFEVGAALAYYAQTEGHLVEIDFQSSREKTYSTTVDVQFWSGSFGCDTAQCHLSDRFLHRLSENLLWLEHNNRIRFTPRYTVYTCPSGYDETACNGQCLSGGRYCSLHPGYAGYTGRNVILLSLHSLCVHSVLNSTGAPWMWHSWLNNFKYQCTMESGNFNVNCSDRIFTELGTHPTELDAVHECVGDEDGVHPLLEENEEERVRQNVVYHPTLVADGVQYRGSLNETTASQFICSAFSADYGKPPICQPERTFGLCDIGQEGSQACAMNPFGATTCVEKKSGFYDCECPAGYEGPTTFIPGGHKVLISECRKVNHCKTHCLGDDMSCTNLIEGYTCSCHNGGNYLETEDSCNIEKVSSSTSLGAGAIIAIVFSVVILFVVMVAVLVKKITSMPDWLMATFKRFSALQEESPGASASSADAPPDEEAGAEDVSPSDEEPIPPTYQEATAAANNV